MLVCPQQRFLTARGPLFSRTSAKRQRHNTARLFFFFHQGAWLSPRLCFFLPWTNVPHTLHSTSYGTDACTGALLAVPVLFCARATCKKEEIAPASSAKSHRATPLPNHSCSIIFL
nr:hypothetical protein [Pandoravirus massiliensis]